MAYLFVDGTYGYGISDGRIEDYRLSASSSEDLPQYARLYHPFKSWCAEGNLPIKFNIKFNEKIDIKAVATQGNPLKEKWVTKYSLSMESNSSMVDAKDITGNRVRCGVI